MTEIIKKIEQLAFLLNLEKQEDFDQYKTLVKSLSMSERVAKGYSWYPIEIIKSGYTYGERAFVIVRRNEEKPHQFRSGTPVTLFTQQPEVRYPEKSGVIQYVNKQQMKIVLNSKDLPDWLGFGGIGVDLQFDERTYVEMEKALSKVMSAQNDRLSELRAILFGKLNPRFQKNSTPISIPYLNSSQNHAVQQMLTALDLAVIHGPPGTGKTTTIVQGIKLLSKTENTILVTAPSNTAVDLLTERLAAQDLTVVRIGNISRIDKSIIAHTLEARLTAHPESKHIKKVKIQAANYRRQARKFKRKFGKEEREERQHLKQQARELAAWARQLEERLIEQILDTAQIITATLVGTANDVLANRTFRTVVIDEAAQALEPATWIPITKASKVILTGDPFQLPPTVKNIKAQRNGFNITLLEKCLRCHQNTSLLNVQYRMHETIMGFSNQQFYNNALQADESIKHQQLEFGEHEALIFIDTAGCGFEEKLNEAYKSRYNPEEFLILREHLLLIISMHEGIKIPSIAIISPYREQVMHMEKSIQEESALSNLPITINTIDGFQGQERDIVYISLVRSNDKSEIGFLKDYRRMNVAMTRAKKMLVVIGDSATIGGDIFYNDFLVYSEKYGSYESAWEYMR